MIPSKRVDSWERANGIQAVLVLGLALRVILPGEAPRA